MDAEQPKITKSLIEQITDSMLEQLEQAEEFEEQTLQLLGRVVSSGKLADAKAVSAVLQTKE